MDEANEETIVVRQGVEAMELEAEFRDGNTVFPKGGFVVFKIDGVECEPLVYLPREIFLEAFDKQEGDDGNQGSEEDGWGVRQDPQPQDGNSKPEVGQ